jgi:hypothetical protein
MWLEVRVTLLNGGLLIALPELLIPLHRCFGFNIDTALSTGHSVRPLGLLANFENV